MATYEQLVARLHKALDLRDGAERRMLAEQPGTAEGRRWHRVFSAAEDKANELHRAVRQHPDAPPAG